MVAGGPGVETASAALVSDALRWRLAVAEAVEQVVGLKQLTHMLGRSGGYPAADGVGGAAHQHAEFGVGCPGGLGVGEEQMGVAYDVGHVAEVDLVDGGELFEAVT